MYRRKQRTFFNIALVVSAPLLLAVLELFHPHPADLLQLDVQRWMAVHYAQIPLFALSAMATTTLVQGRTDPAATIARIALFVFAISFVAFDTVAGVAVGILVDSAQGSATPEAWRGAIDALWTHPLMGGMRLNDEPSLAVLGRVSLAIGTIAAAISLKRNGSSWAPCALLAICSFGINLFHGHSWPGGPLTFASMALSAGWIRWEAIAMTARRHRAATASVHATDNPDELPSGAHVKGRSTPSKDPTTRGD